MEGRKNVPDVLTFYNHIYDYTYDKIPLNPSKPNGYIRYVKRAIDGKLKTYSNLKSRNNAPDRYTPGGPFGDWNFGGPAGAYHFNIKMPDGTFYDINNKNIKKYIKPFLLKCEEFKNQYNGDFRKNEDRFNEMIELCNSLCD